MLLKQIITIVIFLSVLPLYLSNHVYITSSSSSSSSFCSPLYTSAIATKCVVCWSSFILPFRFCSSEVHVDHTSFRKCNYNSIATTHQHDRKLKFPSIASYLHDNSIFTDCLHHFVTSSMYVDQRLQIKAQFCR